MKKIKSITFAVILVISFLSAPVQAAGVAAGGPAAKDSAAAAATISDALRERMAEAGEDERIPVTIELADDMDLENLEQRAVARARISSAELAIMNVDTSGFSEEVNEAHQKLMLELQDEITAERHAIVKEHYTDKINAFISSAGLSKEEYGSLGIFTPFIRDMMLTPAQIQKLSENPQVLSIEYFDDDEGTDFDSIDNTYKIINGNTAVDSGYKGSGVRVGVVESGVPKFSVMGSDSKNIIKTNSGSETDHATVTCGIIRKMAPECTIYCYAAPSMTTVVQDIENLINIYKVQVVNVSYGLLSTGVYDARTRQLDSIINNTKAAVVVSSGNGTPSTGYINILGLAPNAITVGAVTSTGTNPSASGAYAQTNYSIYREAITSVNKPDVCAPGTVSIYSYSGSSGTSVAAPYVTGTVVQMISRNSAMSGNPNVLKAALMASASYNAGSSMSYVSGTKASNQEGAGVIDAGFCYQVARNGRYTQFTATSSSTSFSYNIYCDYTTIPFRVACAWRALSGDGSTNITDYDMSIYKDGAFIASSNANSTSSAKPNTNYEIIELSTSTLSKYGAGYYQIVITRTGSYKGSESTLIGLAWEQR